MTHFPVAGPSLLRAREEHNRRVVSAAPAVSGGFRPETGLKWMAGFFAYGLGLSALYATTGFGLPCLFREVTGWECPLCGGTRMGSALLHLQIGAAFAFTGGSGRPHPGRVAGRAVDCSGGWRPPAFDCRSSSANG